MQKRDRGESSTKATRKFVCPACGLKTGLDILYGFPAPDAIESVETGDLILGGCCREIDAPDRQCGQCGHQWRIKHRITSLE